jgi:hypothetical protein
MRRRAAARASIASLQDSPQPVSHRRNGARQSWKSDTKSVVYTEIPSGLRAESELKYRMLESGRFDTAVVRRSRLGNEAVRVHAEPSIFIRDSQGPLQLNAASRAVFVLREDEHLRLEVVVPKKGNRVSIELHHGRPPAVQEPLGHP